MTNHITRQRRTAQTLRAAAAYIDAHGYYIPLNDMGVDDPDFPDGWYPDVFFPDLYDRHSRTPDTPTASANGAIAFAAYGRPNPDPISDGSSNYERFADAVSQLSLYFAPDGDGYGDWIYPRSLSADLRGAAQLCDFDAEQAMRQAVDADHDTDGW
jgi:hypothetical protein